MLRNEWTEAWERSDTPEPLPMPLQYMVSGEAVARAHQYPEKSLSMMFNPVGQVVGQMTSVRRARDVVVGLVEEYVEAVERLGVGMSV
jgi:NAD(P)H-dependent flavin oxidoreductase YrpB (nitropropane dioxygenase family)